MKKILHSYAQSRNALCTMFCVVLFLTSALFVGCDDPVHSPSAGDVSAPDSPNAGGDGGAGGSGDELPTPPDAGVELPVVPPVDPPMPPTDPPVVPPVMPPTEPPVAPPPAPTDPPVVPPVEPPVNALPSIASTAFAVFENIADTEIIGTVQASDADADDSLSYAITATASGSSLGSGSDLFEIDSITGELSLASGQSLDYETETAHSITVQVSDGTATAEADISINVQNIIEVLNARISGFESTANAQEREFFTINALSSTSDGTISSYLWEQLDPIAGKSTALIESPNSATTGITMPYIEEPRESIRLRLTVQAGDLIDVSIVDLPILRGNIDLDGDGLIDIRGLSMLHNMRYNLAGTSYKTSAGDAGTSRGCPANTCRGYELVRDLSFDRDGDGSTWSGTAGNYSLDADDSQAPYFVVDAQGNGGWQPVGSSGQNNSFTAHFNGNGYSIRGLALDRSSDLNVGLFGITSASARVYNVSVLDALVVGLRDVGILIGESSGGVIAANSVTGTVQAVSSVGGLIGWAQGTTVIANLANAEVNGNEIVGGLLGWSSSALYASYARGSVTSGSSAGSLIGWSLANIVGNYSTGNAQGAIHVGNLVGQLRSGQLIESYGFGEATDTNGGSGDNAPNALGASLPSGVSSAADLSATNVAGQWNSDAQFSLGAWDFTNKTTAGGPSLLYADYDGEAGTLFYCAGESAPSGNSIAVANCGDSLPGQF